MNRIQKAIIASLIATSALAWIASINQPDMMVAMTTYNPLSISLFTVSWTAGMAAMMFPAISPMVLLYNRLIKNEHDNNDNNSGRLGNNREEDKQISSTKIVVEGKDDEDDNQNGKPSSSSSSNSLYFFKMILFV